MDSIRIVVAAVHVAALVTVAAPAWAQTNQTFVSGTGLDTNPCTLAAPCRTFAQALTQTAAHGDITILDPASYGPVSITQSVSIVNDGVGETLVTVASAGDGIDIDIGPNDVVNLRGLTVVGGGVGANGIRFTSLGALNIQNCVVSGFSTGIALAPSGAAQFSISDTTVSNNSANGVALEPTGTATVKALFNRVQAIGSISTAGLTIFFTSTGFAISGASSTGTVYATITNSTASSNKIGIVTATATGMASTTVMIIDSVVANNVTGIMENGIGSTTYLAQNTIAANTGQQFIPNVGTQITPAAFSIQNSGTVASFGDNKVNFNGYNPPSSGSIVGNPIGTPNAKVYPQ